MENSKFEKPVNESIIEEAADRRKKNKTSAAAMNN